MMTDYPVQLSIDIENYCKPKRILKILTSGTTNRRLLINYGCNTNNADFLIHHNLQIELIKIDNAPQYCFPVQYTPDRRVACNRSTVH